MRAVNIADSRVCYTSAVKMRHLGKSVKAGVARVAKVVEDDDRHHEKGISHREDVERGATEVLGPHIEVKISLVWIKRINFRGFILNSKTCCLELWWCLSRNWSMARKAAQWPVWV